jgi:hypothetical protein
LQKAKDFFTGLYGKVALVLGAVIGFLLYYITLRNKEVNAAKAKVALANTEKQADILETEIVAMKEGRKINKKEVAEIDKTLVELNNKREILKAQAKTMTGREIEDYWNNE